MVPEKIESDTIKHGGAFIQASAPPPERTSVYADRRLKLDRLLSTRNRPFGPLPHLLNERPFTRIAPR